MLRQISFVMKGGNVYKDTVSAAKRSSARDFYRRQGWDVRANGAFGSTWVAWAAEGKGLGIDAVARFRNTTATALPGAGRHQNGYPRARYALYPMCLRHTECCRTGQNSSK